MDSLRDVKNGGTLNTAMIFTMIYTMERFGEFQVYNGVPFIEARNSLALMNMDFFRPYKHVQYSVGAIYLTILNLPHNLRYK